METWLLLAAVAGGRAAELSLCVQAVGCDWPGGSVQWRERIRGVQYMVCTTQIDVLTFSFFTVNSKGTFFIA